MIRQLKEDAIRALSLAASATAEESEHRLLRYCYAVLTGEASTDITPDMLVAHAKQATNEIEFHERMAAAYALDGRHNEAVDALRVAAEELRPDSSLYATPVRLVSPCPAATCG